MGSGSRGLVSGKSSQGQGLKERPPQASSGGAAEIRGILRGGGSVPGSATHLRVPAGTDLQVTSPKPAPGIKHPLRSRLRSPRPHLAPPPGLPPTGAENFELPTSGVENQNHVRETAEAGDG